MYFMVSLLHPGHPSVGIPPGFCRKFSFEAICGMVSPSDPCCRRRGATMAISFKGAHFPQDIILMGVRWYVAYPLSTRHVEELMLERGVHVDHSTINRWVVTYSPQLEIYQSCNLHKILC